MAIIGHAIDAESIILPGTMGVFALILMKSDPMKQRDLSQPRCMKYVYELSNRKIYKYMICSACCH